MSALRRSTIEPLTGRPSAERRDQLAGIRRVLRRLVGADPLDRALAEPLRVLRDHLRLLVGDHGGDRRAGAGDGAHQRADHGAADHRRNRRPPALEGGKVGAAELAGKILPVEDLPRLADQLADREQADDDGDLVEPRADLPEAEVEARHQAHRVEADHADADPERRRHQALDDVVAGQADQRHHAEAVERENLRIGEIVGEAHQRHDQHDEHQDADQLAAERRDEGDAERQPALAALVQRVAVDDGEDGGRIAGNAHQDGGDRVAVLHADADGEQEGDAVDRRHGEGEGQHEAVGEGGADARHGADDDAEERSDEDEQPDADGLSSWRSAPMSG